MVNLDRKKLLCISVIIILVGSIAASVWVGMPKNSRLIGIAYFGDPVAGGTLTVYDLNGNRLFEAQDATMSNGVFILNVGWTWLWNIPKEFKVSITGGTLNDTPFTDTITRYIQNYDPNNYYTVNSITTLLAAYKDNNPSLNDADIENSVATFLEIPSTTSLQNVIDNAYYTRLFFDETVFSEESKTNGGFSSFVNGLLGEIEQGKTHSLAGENLIRGGGGSLFSMAAGEI